MEDEVFDPENVYCWEPFEYEKMPGELVDKSDYDKLLVLYRESQRALSCWPAWVDREKARERERLHS
jgi:hypothetical protein